MRPTSSNSPWLTLAVAACLPGLASAQSLQELYEAARAYDAAFLAARANLQAAEYRAAQSEALARPSAAATASGTHSQLDMPRLGQVSNTTLAGSLQGRYSLYNRANGVTIEQARKSLDASRAEVEAVEQDLAVRVAQAYFDVLASQDALATAQTAKKAIAEQLASAKRNFEVGTATITDTREAQARFDLSTAAEIAAENDLRTKRIALDQLVGRPNVQPRPLALPVTLPATQPSGVEAWVRDAESRHPAVRRASVGVETADLEVAKARAAEGPTVDAVGTLGAQNANGGAVSLPGRTFSASAGVQMNWPLYTGGATQNRIRETMSLLDKSRNDLEAARRSVAQVTRQAFFGVQSGLAQVKALEAAESSSKLALEATQTGYRVGVRVNLDVLNAQTQLFQTQRDLAKARYDVVLGGLKLRQAAGVLGPGDIEAVNRLLAR